MIFGISLGRVSSSDEFGAGISDRRMASREASSIRRERRVDTECRAKVTKITMMIMKMRIGLRMLGQGLCGLECVKRKGYILQL